MEKLRSIEELRDWRRRQVRRATGFVPTMGALHAGHLTLMDRAHAECDVVLASIFVNPAQFNDPDDCSSYPTPLEEDLALCERHGVGAVFLPEEKTMYPDGYRFRVVENEESRCLEGKFRPGHFDGVLTVVMKLLQLVQADRAYFGEKDWQQLRLVTDMAAAFFLPTKIVPVPTVREEDGLALSSRNGRLSAEARIKAPEFARILRERKSPAEAWRELEAAGFTVEYVEDRDGRRLGAVMLEGVRLIDNLPLVETAAQREATA